MPGRNSNFDPKKLSFLNRLCTTKVHIGLVTMFLFVEIVGIIRFYFIFDHLRFTLESALITIFLIFIDVMVIKGLWATKDADPGYLVPMAEQETLFDADTRPLTTCKKCGY